MSLKDFERLDLEQLGDGMDPKASIMGPPPLESLLGVYGPKPSLNPKPQMTLNDPK